jgi:small nuclear ribonucleoprotein (snRNP)-like protein
MFFIFYDRVQIKIKKGYYIFRLLPKLKGTEQLHNVQLQNVQLPNVLLQNVQDTKRPGDKTSRIQNIHLPNVQLQNV